MNKKGTFKCKNHDIIYQCIPQNILDNCGCEQCRREKIGSKLEGKHRGRGHQKSQEEFETEVELANPGYKILGKYHPTEKILGLCPNGHELLRPGKDWIRTRECSYCSGSKVYKGFENSVADKRPDLVKYFKDKKEATLYTPDSTHHVLTVCPNCVFEKEYRINNLNSDGFYCENCDVSNISSGNMILREFISQIIEIFKVEKPLPISVKTIEMPINIDGVTYHYDGAFIFNKQLFFIEIDGIQHKDGWSYHLDKEYGKENDKIKTKKAKELNAVLVRIPYNCEPEKEVIEGLQNSILKNYFNLTKIDWQKCKEAAFKNIIKEVCDTYNEDPTLTYNELTEKFSLYESTIRNYLKKGAELGWNPPYKRVKPKKPQGSSRINRQVKVFVYDKNLNFLEEFDSYQRAREGLNKKLNLHMDISFVEINFNNPKYYSKYNLLFFGKKLSQNEIKEIKKILLTQKEAKENRKHKQTIRPSERGE